MALKDVDNQYGSWSLSASASNAPPESLITLDCGREGVYDPDRRRKVDPSDIQEGAIVKLMIQYKNQEPSSAAWAMGTGWLIAPDVLVTAAHCTYDWGNNLGQAATVKAYIGYQGKSSIGTKGVQLRMGKRVITTVGWLQSLGKDRASDVSFIQLERPFTGSLCPFKFQDTATRESSFLGVVGYPGDQTADGERGAVMYEEFATVDYDVVKSRRNLLDYRISAFGGQSGAPVLRKGENGLVAVGTHVYAGEECNSASTIAGAFGNDYSSMTAALTQPGNKLMTLAGVDIIESSLSSARQSSLPKNPTEDFMDIFHDVAKFRLPAASTALSTLSPFLGPVGPVAAVGGVALGALGAILNDSSDLDRSVDSSTISRRGLDGAAERAVLGEAALQTVQMLDLETIRSLQILSGMESAYQTLEPALKLAPEISRTLMEPSLRIAIDDLTRPKQPENAVESRRPLAYVNDTETFADSDQAKFAEALIGAPTLIVQGEERFFDKLGSIILKGIKYSSPIVTSSAKSALHKLVEANSWSVNSVPDFHPTSNDKTAEILFKRAIMGGAALQAIIKIDPEKLETLQLYDNHNELFANGFFDNFKNVVQKIGRTVVTTAPGVIQSVTPIAADMLKNAPI